MAKGKPAKRRVSVDDRMLIRHAAEKELEKARQKMADELAEIAVVAVGVTAFDELNLTGENLRLFVQKFLLQFDCLAAGTVAVEDLKEILATETDCEFNCVR